MGKKLTTDIFIEKCIKIHGSKYDYSKVVYKRGTEKVLIICPIHGEFLQTPEAHSSGRGCPTCVHRNRITTIDWIKMAEKIHGNRYDYSKSVYIKNKSKVIIICPIHGEFLQTPNNHLNGLGCKHCSFKYKYSITEFIEKSNKVHLNEYDYSNVIYKNKDSKVEIICKKHGSFLQSPRSHWSGSGCPYCGSEKTITNFISKKEIEFLNYLHIPAESRGQYIHGFVVDGIDKKNKIIYEFLGDYWHGNPEKFNSDDINKSANKTFGELYNHTFHRFKILKKYKYSIKYIWENDWNKFNNHINVQFKLEDFNG